LLEMLLLVRAEAARPFGAERIYSSSSGFRGFGVLVKKFEFTIVTVSFGGDALGGGKVGFVFSGICDVP